MTGCVGSRTWGSPVGHILARAPAPLREALVAAGTRNAVLNTEARTMDADVLSRRCVLMRLLDFSYERYQKALRQSAGAVVIILPRAVAAVPQDVIRVSLPAPLCRGPGPEASMGKGSGFGVSGVTFGQALYLPAQHASGRGVVPAPCSPAPSSLPPGDTETPAVVTAQGASGCEGVGARDAGQHPSEWPHPRERWDPRSAVPGGGFELMGSDRTPQGPVREGAFAGAGGVMAKGASCQRPAQCCAAPVRLGSLHPSPCRAKWGRDGPGAQTCP